MSIKQNNNYEQLIAQKNYLMIENASVDFMIEFDVDFSIFQFVIQTFYKNIFFEKKAYFKNFILDIKHQNVYRRNDQDQNNQELFGTNEKYNDFMFDWIDKALEHECPLELVENNILVKENNSYYLFSKQLKKRKQKR